ncbi:MAG TPA: cupredoxin domain-containing protein [Anaerolineales bacterium]|nr:cupredoxin domain-containing protein [Anaerolineales bacterium]
MRRMVWFSCISAALMMVLAACGPTGNNVTVTMTDFAFEPSRTDFAAGETYTFTITNKGAVAHEFVIAEPLDEGEMHGEMHEEGEMEHAGLIVEVEEDELPPGGKVTIDVTFPSPAPDHALEFACHIEGHYEAGMHTPITVQ